MNSPLSRSILTRFWMLGLLACVAPSVAKPESVWVSTTVPPNSTAMTPINLLSDSTGELWAISNQPHPAARVSLAIVSSLNGLWSSTNHGLTYPSYSETQAAIADNQGYIHFFSHEIAKLRYVKMGHETVTIEDVTWILGPDLMGGDIQLASENRPIGILYSGTSFYYFDRLSGAWATSVIPEFGKGDASTNLTLSLNKNDEPTVAISTGSVRVFKRISGTWTLTNSFPGWNYALLKNDTKDRTHLFMSKRIADDRVLARYLRWDSNGTMEMDQAFDMGKNGLLNQDTDLDIDRDDNPRFLVGATYFDLFGSSVTVPLFEGVEYGSIKMTLVRGEFPFFLIYYPFAPIATRLEVLTNTVGGPPGTPVLGERSNEKLSWSFAPSTGSVLGYLMVRPTDDQVISPLLPVGTTTYIETGLSGNEPREFYIRTVYPGFIQESPPGPKIFTLARPPENIQLVRNGASDLSAGWTTAGNVSGTVYRLQLMPPRGSPITQDTVNASARFSVDPSIPHALTLAAVNGNGLESPLSTASAGEDSGGSWFLFSLSNGLRIRLDPLGSAEGPKPVFAVLPAASFPSAPVAMGNDSPTGVGFEVPSVNNGQTRRITLLCPEGILTGHDSFVLARYDTDRAQWLPLATRWDKTQNSLTALTDSDGLFQVLGVSSPPTTLAGVQVSPNPFRPSEHGLMTVQGAPPGARTRIFTNTGRSVADLSAQDGVATWDARDNTGEPAPSGVYVLRVELNGETQRTRFVLER